MGIAVAEVQDEAEESGALDTSITFTLSTAQKESLRRIATRRQLKMGHILRELIREFLGSQGAVAA